MSITHASIWKRSFVPKGAQLWALKLDECLYSQPRHLCFRFSCRNRSSVKCAKAGIDWVFWKSPDMYAWINYCSEGCSPQLRYTTPKTVDAQHTQTHTYILDRSVVGAWLTHTHIHIWPICYWRLTHTAHTHNTQNIRTYLTNLLLVPDTHSTHTQHTQNTRTY
jgi:hypothetical protein